MCRDGCDEAPSTLCGHRVAPLSVETAFLEATQLLLSKKPGARVSDVGSMSDDAAGQATRSRDRDLAPRSERAMADNVRATRHYGRVPVEPYESRIRYLGISLEKGTSNVPADGRYHVLDGTTEIYSSPNLVLAQAYFELLAEQAREAHPELKDPRERIASEQAFRDILSVRGEARQRARTQQEAKGGKGGRSGV